MEGPFIRPLEWCPVNFVMDEDVAGVEGFLAMSYNRNCMQLGYLSTEEVYNSVG